MTDAALARLRIAALTGVICLIVLLALWPELDLMVSTALTDGQGNFIAVRMGFPVDLSAVLRRVMETLALAAIVYTAWLWLARRTDKDWLYGWSFVSGSFLLGPGLIVNLVLKEHVGRARPANVTFFGGQNDFTAAFRISDQCATNCSFSSGEAALAATWALVVVSLLWGGLSPQGRSRALLIGGAFWLVGAGLRVVLGRHFLSDVLVSTLIAVLVTMVLYRLLNIAGARDAFTPARLRARAKVLTWRR